MRVRRAGETAHHQRQVEVQHTLVLGGLQAVVVGTGPQPGVLGVGFNQLDLRVFAAGELQVFNGLLIDVEHRRGGTELWRHVGDGCTVAQREAGGARAIKLKVARNHFLRAQKLGQGQHRVGGGDAWLRLAA